MKQKNICRKLIFAIIILGFFYFKAECQSAPNECLDSLLKRDIKCKLKGGGNVRIHSDHIRNAAYAYSYWIPLNFKEVIPLHHVYTDTERYISPDKRCSLKIWPGQTINFPLGQVDSLGKFIGVKCSDITRVEKIVINYILALKEGKEKEIKGLKIIEFCSGVSGYNFQIALKGRTQKFGYIYKVEVSEIPVSGDLIFKHFLYKYDLKCKDQYERIGVAMANSFSEF